MGTTKTETMTAWYPKWVPQNRNDRLVPKVGTINLAVKKGMVP